MFFIGGKPCGAPPWNKPKRYAPNKQNEAKFKEYPWMGIFPECPLSSNKRDLAKVPRVREPQNQMELGRDWLIRQAVLNKGKFLGRGKEATVYAYRGAAYKIFNLPLKDQKIQDNITFLLEYRLTGVVPRFFESSAAAGWICMQNLQSSFFFPLSSQVLKKSKEHRYALLKHLAKARSILSADIDYHDLKKWDNIAVKYHKGMPIAVKFYERGPITHYHDHRLQVHEYIKEMASNLRIKNDAFTRSLLREFNL